MLEKIIDFSIKNKLIVILFTLTIVGFGLFAVYKIPVGTVPDITNNQVQVITTSGQLSTQEIEQFITAPVEMAMANLPGVIEIRSISKFGISLVTVVFEDEMGTYLPRQLIAEKIKSAAADIPEGYGVPEMGPISTGLGEIYQYILDVEPGYEDVYSPMDLRTIQDWIVKRRLSGITGVVEVNSWGGYLKQYEVAIDPILLHSVGVTLMEVYDALKDNNTISGGAYIEKTNQSYFIRGDGQIKSIEDIQNTVVSNQGETPLLIKDVAQVHFGYANRFGAITANGKGETILGQIMMLKDADSKVVINAVKQRVEEIQKSLPEGVFINPILERGELIGKTSFTVTENLILGAIIVLFIVVLLLGNWRSALVIASMIPLALLFTISMMYIFGIDANLMSLGALDFGIIIDGAVIIVEFIALRMTILKSDVSATQGDERQSIMDKISLEGASKMMKSAIFGQVIILIVFIPILSLQGVEGKMFRPMALSFSFAIIGAMLFGLTWLPVASSLFLRPNKAHKHSISAWIMQVVHNSYSPVIKWSCDHKQVIFGAALFSLVLTGVLFSKIGGEFVPTLDEGDYVIQPVLKTGTSLSKTIEMTTAMEGILLEQFPDEVSQIVSRIGAAEVPTDPMSMEEIDMIIKLKPRKAWVKVDNKEDLADQFKTALSVIPGVEYEFTQPIEMRFNELITGVRSDIAIKVYGEDLDYITAKASEIKTLIEQVPGAGDIILEKTSGLPQIKVVFNRQKIAEYGVSIDFLNTYLSTAFAGRTAGVIFEGERRFDLVMRFQSENRTDIDDIKRMMVPVSEAMQVPLSVLADITYTEGPAKISRDNTHRRVVVSVNVRNRDLQSVVEDIRLLVDADINLLPGNYIEYGGQFENLENATNRLLLAVPVALLLIFIFLHFAFKSMKDAIMIFTAIPLATVGGVFLLWFRGMPFSVSAGVGFIALFGIAVLNGIVLIEHLKELQNSGSLSMREVIIQGTQNRLRPVLLTAGAAAMGFLPMAISHGAGAEVQRPLATVVIGGLVTSTLLTMIALPLLFEVFYNVVGIRFSPLRLVRSKACTALIVLLLMPAFIKGQTAPLDLRQVITIALENNKDVAAYALKVDEAEALKKTAFSPDKTVVSYSMDQNNVAANGHPLQVLGIEQSFSFPTLYLNAQDVKALDFSIADTERLLQQNNVVKVVSTAFYEFQMLTSQRSVYYQLDSLFKQLTAEAQQRLDLKDITKLEELGIKATSNQLQLKLKGMDYALDNVMSRLKVLMNYQAPFSLASEEAILPILNYNNDTLPVFNLLDLYNQRSSSMVKLVRSEALPDIHLNYFVGSNAYANADNYHGFGVGFAIPLFYGHHKARIKAAQFSSDAQTLLLQNEMARMENSINALSVEQRKYGELIQNYTAFEQRLVAEIMRTSLRAYELKEIDFYAFIRAYEAAVELKISYFKNIFEYNRVTLDMMYFSN